jgi:hypothetical protein
MYFRVLIILFRLTPFFEDTNLSANQEGARPGFISKLETRRITEQDVLYKIHLVSRLYTSFY